MHTWRAYPLPLNNLDQLQFGDCKEEPTNSGPTFFRCAPLMAGVQESCCFIKPYTMGGSQFALAEDLVLCHTLGHSGYVLLHVHPGSACLHMRAFLIR